MATAKDFDKLEQNPVFIALLEAIELNQEEVGDPVPPALIQRSLPKTIALDEQAIIDILDGLVEFGYLGRKVVRMRRGYYTLGPLDRLSRL